MACTLIHFTTTVAVPVLLGIAASPAEAQLGGSLPPSQAAHAAVVKNVLNGAVRTRSWLDEGGTTINEYTSADGTIFAYAWHGPTMPNLRHLLGRYADTYLAAATSRFAADGNLHASHVVHPALIVDSGGQMRSYVGRAWLPAALPPGVTPADLQ
jgi:hypothetical protein